ncbi:MAG: TonB-dependent receptor [Bacteroidota bacterium]|nr:TonB-dependent receptor [Bacteroidota bacterium]
MKISIKISALIILFFTGGSQLLAQQVSKLTGQIKDKNGLALPYVNVSLVEQKEDKLITGVVSDENGRFTLVTERVGSFRAEFSFIGYQTLVQDVIALAPGDIKDFGVLILQEQIESLKEVTVIGNKPGITIQADRIVVSVEGTVLAQGNTALDVISKSPGVYVDGNNNISLNGRSGVLVMIDDRKVYMSADELAAFLRAIPADNIKSLELINNPPAKYDADGSAGLININLKKNTLDGIHGNLNLGNQYNGIHTPFVGGSINFKRQKWTTNASLNFRESARIMDIDIIRRFQSEKDLSVFTQKDRIILFNKDLLFSGATDYQINDKHSIGINLVASQSRTDNDGKSAAQITGQTNSDINFLRSLSDGKSDNQRLYTNLHYIWKIDTVGSSLTADLDVAKADGGRNGLLNNTYWLNEQGNNQHNDRILTLNSMDHSIFTAKVDFTKFLGKRIFETGVKGSWVKSDNDLNMSTSIGEEQFLPHPNSNQFIYDENVLAAYVSFNGPIGEKISFKAGLRGEYSTIISNSISSDKRNSQQYFNLFPSIFVQHKASDSYRIIYMVNRRISRPTYSQLNPFILYIGRYATEEGNPFLKPEYSNNVEINNVFKDKYQLTFSYSLTTQAFQQIVTQNEETLESRLQIKNFDKLDYFGMRILAPIDVTSGWSIDNMFQLYYNRFKIQIGKELFDQSQLSYMARMQHNFSLPKSFKLEVSGMYISPFQQGQMKIVQGFAWVDAGIKKTFWKDKLTVSLNGNDILRTQKVKHKIKFNNINTDLNQYNNLQAVRLSVNYKFSRGKKVESIDRSGNTEERNRLD